MNKGNEQMTTASPFVKAVAIIQSCETLEQMTIAFRYAKFAGAWYNDNNYSFRILARIWNAKLQELKK